MLTKSATGGTFNLRLVPTAGPINSGGVTTILGGASNLLTLDGGTLNILASVRAGTVNFANTINLVMNNNAIRTSADNVGSIYKDFLTFDRPCPRARRPR